MDKFRVYRLPSSREVWLVDSGPETEVHRVRGIEIKCHAISRDNPAETPRAWLEVDAKEMFIMGDVAIFAGAA